MQQEIRVMMLCMTGRVDGDKFQVADLDRLRIFRDLELILLNGQELTPKLVHPISVNARSAGNELFRIKHMRSTHRMDIHFRALAG